MKVKFANKIYEVLFTKELAGLTMYAVEDEPNHIDWLINVDVVDAEKKELKKIEHPECSKDNLSDFESYLCLMFQKFRTKGICTNGEIIDFVEKHVQKLKDTLCSTWNEEDESMALGIEQLCNCASLLNIAPEKIDKIRTWLKSLKERIGCEVNCTTTNKWSEEDEKILKTITSDVLRMRQKCGIGTDEWNIRSNALNWLKYHLSQRRWKPTEKQLMELKCAIRGCSFNIEQLVSLEEQLEQL